MAADEIYDLFDTLLSVADTLHCPPAGTKYLYAWTNEDSKKDWRADGYRWRQNGNSIVKSQDGAMKKTFFYVREKSYAKLQRINRLIYLGLRQRRSSLNPFTFELAHITELCSKSSLGSANLKLVQHSRIISLFTVLNNFIRNRTTTKSIDLKELFWQSKTF